MRVAGGSRCVVGEEDEDSPLSLGQGRLAEGTSPNAGDSGTGKAVEVRTPTSGQALTDGIETDDYEADEEEEDESDSGSNEDERPTKKRKRDATIAEGPEGQFVST